jgi:hypothetical protein
MRVRLISDQLDLRRAIMDLTKPENVKALMVSSKTENDWNTNCEKVKHANGGYPSWWFETIVLSGLASTTAAKFRS